MKQWQKKEVNGRLLWTVRGIEAREETKKKDENGVAPHTSNSSKLQPLDWTRASWLLLVPSWISRRLARSWLKPSVLLH